MDKSTREINWGILGAGRIAGTFATDLKKLEGARLLAVGSRSQDKAGQFAHEYGCERAYGSYEALIADPEVDVIYVATPHPYHLENAQACLRGDKAVLCEKPMALNAGQVRDMVACARERGLFMMEAMWTRFLPVTAEVRKWLAAGRIGEIRLFTADFGFRTGWNPEGRLLNPALGGGALLDVGVYTVAYAAMVLGRSPETVQAQAHIGATGVDEQSALLLGYDGGRLAVLSCAVRTSTRHGAYIDGAAGSIHIDRFWRATSATLRVEDQDPVTFEAPAGYHYEAQEVMDCLRAGELESPLMPLDESIAIAETLDRARAQIGLRYPME
ncbi:MAG: Gfo/Idh/MocA family oxidoreductase [Chloroflexi bacterium]|nr:Gfo/Idh/MocA family oxidoreductase [Chloroflexota bacterium]